MDQRPVAISHKALWTRSSSGVLHPRSSRARGREEGDWVVSFMVGLRVAVGRPYAGFLERSGAQSGIADRLGSDAEMLGLDAVDFRADGCFRLRLAGVGFRNDRLQIAFGVLAAEPDRDNVIKLDLVGRR